MWIQFLLIAAIVVLAAFMMRRTGADSHLAIRRILMGLFVVVAVLSVLFPSGSRGSLSSSASDAAPISCCTDSS